MKVLFCVPAYGSTVRAETMVSVAATWRHLSRTMPEIEVRLLTIDLAEISRVRNLFASIALQDGFDALISLDADMSVPPETFGRLLASPHEVCGATYPKRRIDLATLHQMARSGADLKAATGGALEFMDAASFVQKPNGEVDVIDSFLEMHQMPGGCMMIRTSALRRLWDECPELRQTEGLQDFEAGMGAKTLLRCFDPIQTPTGTASEDYSFCRRWTGIGGRIHALIDVPVAHYGSMKFEGRYADMLLAQASDFRPKA